MSNIDRHKDCPMRTKLGNCEPIGGFCTSINEWCCELAHSVYRYTQMVNDCKRQQIQEENKGDI